MKKEKSPIAARWPWILLLIISNIWAIIITYAITKSAYAVCVGSSPSLRSAKTAPQPAVDTAERALRALPAPSTKALPTVVPSVAKAIALPPVTPVKWAAEGRFEQSWRSYTCKARNTLKFNPPTVVYGPNGEKLVRYDTWSVSDPQFIRKDHEMWWKHYAVVKWRQLSGCPWKGGELFFCEPEYSSGSLSIMENTRVAGTGPKTHVCSPTGNSGDLILNGALASGNPIEFDTVFWADITATWTYQHFVQNTLPKMAQTSLFMPELFAQGSNVTAIQELALDRYPIINQFYSHLGWNVMDARTVPITAKKLIYPCNTPPLHPSLWQIAQENVLQIRPKPLDQRRKLVYAGRTRVGRIENDGRQVENEKALFSLFQHWSEFEFVQFDHREYRSLPQLAALFADARVLIGPHGGALTNIIFMGCDATVIELFPLVKGEKAPLRHAGMMMYLQSMFLRHDYWMLPIGTRVEKGDFDAPIIEVCEILMTSLGAPMWLREKYGDTVSNPADACVLLLGDSYESYQGYTGIRHPLIYPNSPST